MNDSDVVTDSGAMAWFHQTAMGQWSRQRFTIFWVRVALVGLSTFVAIKVIQPTLVFSDLSLLHGGASLLYRPP